MAPGTTGQRSPAERRWSENLDAPVPSRRRAHAVEIDWSRRLETRRQRFAGAAVESLARAWSLQTQNASPLRCDQECVRNASREHCHAAASERLLATIDVDEDLALQHVEGLIHLRVRVEGRGFALSHDIVEQQERASGLSICGEPGVYTTTVEPQLLALTLDTYDRNQRAHRHVNLTSASWDISTMTRL